MKPARNPWGPAKWRKLHQAALAGELTPKWMERLTASLPNRRCRCMRHWQEVLAYLPPPYQLPPEDLFLWSVAAHNLVNERLEKPYMRLADAKRVQTLPPPHHSPPPEVARCRAGGQQPPAGHLPGGQGPG